jgi:hypothetical protein
MNDDLIDDVAREFTRVEAGRDLHARILAVVGAERPRVGSRPRLLPAVAASAVVVVVAANLWGRWSAESPVRPGVVMGSSRSVGSMAPSPAGSLIPGSPTQAATSPAVSGRPLQPRRVISATDQQPVRLFSTLDMQAWESRALTPLGIPAALEVPQPEPMLPPLLDVTPLLAAPLELEPLDPIDPVSTAGA